MVDVEGEGGGVGVEELNEELEGGQGGFRDVEFLGCGIVGFAGIEGVVEERGAGTYKGLGEGKSLSLLFGATVSGDEDLDCRTVEGFKLADNGC